MRAAPTTGALEAGLPDFSSQNVPKTVKEYNKWEKNIF
jgi:hypothetical protein